MYSTCLFCHANLGANESVEHFPVGRRLAFDGALGRLWVVCRRCERWNLSPLDERWEAIEECERLFRSTRLRVSTDNIGLARVGDGLELVRIGSPLRPEMAAWRYGDQFGRRRKKHLMWSGAALAAVGGLIVLGPGTGLIAGSSLGIWNLASAGNTWYQARRVRAKLPLPEHGAIASIRLKDLNRAALLTSEAGWALRVTYELGATTPQRLSNGRMLEASRFTAGNEVVTTLSGEAALEAAGRLLPAINASGANRGEVDDAVRVLSERSDPIALFEQYATNPPAATQRRGLSGDAGQPLVAMPKHMRLALEMATHEETERRALEGELAQLEQAWRLAEEIAGIADDLFVPEETRARLSELKKHSDAPDLPTANG